MPRATTLLALVVALTSVYAVQALSQDHAFIRNPAAALKLDAETVTNELEKAVREHYLLHHDYLQCFQDEGFSDMKGAVRIFAENHYTYSKNFIKYLRLVADKVRPDLQHLLLENIAEEEGNYEEEDLVTLEKEGVPRAWVNKKPHRDLIRRFLNAADVDQSMFNRTDHPGGRFTSWIINKYKKANACEALSMIGFAIEETVSILYSYLWNGLKKTDMNAEDYVFFPLHILVDDGHADLLKTGFKSYWDANPEECKAAPRLVLEVLDRRSTMMDELRELVDAEFGNTCTVPHNPERASQLGAIRRARALTRGMPQPEWTQLEKMALSARILARQGQGYTLSGQITCRSDNEDSTDVTMWTQAYGNPLELIRPQDFVNINSDLEVIEGTGFPNLATRFHLHVYRARPDIKCAIHTHAPWTSALAMTGKPLHVGHMDTMAHFNDVAHLKVWPGVPFGDEEGEIITAAIGDKYKSLLAGHHGLFVGGATIEEATYRAYFFEHAAEMQMRAMAAMNDGEDFPPVVYSAAKRAHDWRGNPGPVAAHFNSWARQVIVSGNNPLTQTDADVCAGTICYGSHA